MALREGDLRLVVSVESLTIFLDGFGQMFTVDSLTGDACLCVSVLNDDFEFCFMSYGFIALLFYYLIALLL